MTTSSTSSSCSHWWHAPFYVAATVALLVASFSSPPPSTSSTATSSRITRQQAIPPATFDADVVTNLSTRWDRVVMVLGSRGYASFAVGVNSVLDAVVRASSTGAAAGGVTVFAPGDEGFDKYVVGSSKGILEGAVLRHVVAGVFEYREIQALAVEGRDGLRTLDGREIVLRAAGGGDGKTTAVVQLNGVEISRPELHREMDFVVHGLAGPLPFNIPSLPPNPK